MRRPPPLPTALLLLLPLPPPLLPEAALSLLPRCSCTGPAERALFGTRDRADAIGRTAADGGARLDEAAAPVNEDGADMTTTQRTGGSMQAKQAGLTRQAVRAGRSICARCQRRCLVMTAVKWSEAEGETDTQPRRTTR